jgi:putative Holliday junction resolvase
MGRIMAFDYGRKRVGIAVTDNLHLIANGLTTLSPDKIFPFLYEYQKNEKIDEFVVGLPKQMNNEYSESIVFINPFVEGLKNKFPDIPVIMFDERFTSKLAQKAIFESGVNKKHRQDKALVDQVSATIILQDYLESKR